MFGRKKDDEEYIAPVEEYRDDGEYSDEYNGYSGGDCASHSHGSTYETKEYRDDCSDHSHEQTYEDYNSEQSAYDQASNERAQFEAVLQPGENILWMGEPDKNAKMMEKGAPALIKMVSLVWLLVIFFTFLTVISSTGISGAVLVIPFVIFGLVIRLSVGNSKNMKYAITDRRIITLKKGKAISSYFGNIHNLRQYTSANNMGFVTYVNRVRSENGRVVSTVNSGLFGIREPKKVYDLLVSLISYNDQRR